MAETCGAELIYDHSGTKVTYVCDRPKVHRDVHSCGHETAWSRGATDLSDAPAILTSTARS